ncbi:MAG TPA: ABC transporter permease [Thermoleophilia bacterium]|jgi:peptide/nickel transport system permease protein|nr:ABC transporter permease [Acidobacteriota bacterium]HOU28707.1 ABC transporter permease [Thermoleophilia bacterium]HQF51986.1 ABC transporter permease [Thermoleophilia bacterium]HQH21234.1 ABC transporter permease [Thermoleophilia bacterium]
MSTPMENSVDLLPEGPEIPHVTASRRHRREWVQTAKAAWALRRTKIGVGLFLVILAIALFGPLIAPYGPTEFVGKPYRMPSATAWLGTDNLGRDVLTRVLNGGRTVFSLSLTATAVGMAMGILLGMFAGYSRRSVDDFTMRALDIVMAFPHIVFVLLIVAALGPRPWLIALAVAIGHAPRVARVARGATLEIVGRDFILASEMLGTAKWRIMVTELFPNITSPMFVEFGLRLAYSIGTIAALSFLGFGLQPPAADWGLMINENRIGVAVQPYSVFVPVVMIALLTIAVSLIADGLARAIIGIDRRTGTE